MDKTLLIDGHNYLYRAYYGVPDAARLNNGLQVNAFYGFLASLRKVAEHLDSSTITVVFDSETGIKSKKAQNPNYKNNRREPDLEMFEQLPIIKDALDYAGIPYIEHPNYEADDIIGTIANKTSSKESVYISSQDRDFFQLINENISILRFEKGAYVEYNPEVFVDYYGFGSDRFLEYMAMRGDPSDNIIGVKGVGPVTAKKFVDSTRSAEDLLENSGIAVIDDNKDLIQENLSFLEINKQLAIDYQEKKYDQGKLNLSSNEILYELGYDQ